AQRDLFIIAQAARGVGPPELAHIHRFRETPAEPVAHAPADGRHRPADSRKIDHRVRSDRWVPIGLGHEAAARDIPDDDVHIRLTRKAQPGIQDYANAVGFPNRIAFDSQLLRRFRHHCPISHAQWLSEEYKKSIVWFA